MRKRFFGLLIALAFALPFVTAAPCFADTGETTIGQITYAYDTESGEAAVINVESNISGGVAVPGMITVDGREYTVTLIASGAFSDCRGLTKVTIPESVESIGEYEFLGCDELVDIYVGKNSNYSFHDSLNNIHIWRYEVLKSTDDVTHVKIVSVEDQGGGSIPNSFDIQCDAVGNGYVVDEIEPSYVSLKHNFTIPIPATPATCTNSGNKEYWECEGCGKYFTIEDGVTPTPIAPEDIEIPATGHSYENGKCTVCGAIDPDFKTVITAGANGTWQKGAKDGLSFTSNAAFADFQKVSVDGKDLDASSYTVEEGSTIVTLQPSYLDTLSVGKHTLAIVSETGTAETEFTVAAAEEQAVPEGQVTDNEVVNSVDKESLPKTGDGSVLPIAVLSILVIVSIVAGVLALRRSCI